MTDNNPSQKTEPEKENTDAEPKSKKEIISSDKKESVDKEKMAIKPESDKGETSGDIEKNAPKETTDAVSKEDEFEASEYLLSQAKKEHEKNEEELKRLRQSDKKDKAARVFTKKRLRDTKTALKKGGDKIAERAVHVKDESLKLIEEEKKKVTIHFIKKSIDEQLTKLGCEVYDLQNQGITDVFNKTRVKNILNQITKYTAEIQSIRSKKKQDKKQAA